MKILPKVKFLIQINYKSGHTIKETFLSFKVIRNNDGSLDGVEYELLNKSKQFLFVGINDVESVLVLKTSRWL